MPTIVHLEDDPWIAREVGQACSKAGFRYIWLSEPPDTLVDTICSYKPDGVLSDINMPRTSGLVVVHALRSDPRTRSLPIMLYTTMQSDTVREQAFAAGATDFFTKYATSPEDVVAALVLLIAHHA